MAFLPYTAGGGELPTLVNITKRLDPNGSFAKIAELLTQFNPILDDIPMVEGNLPVGHRTTVRADVPAGTWRKLNYGVMPTKSNTVQIDESMGMLEAYGEVDKDLAMLNGNTAEFRLSEDTPHIEGMSNDMATALFYSDTATDPEKFLGLTPRYASLGTKSTPTATINSTYLDHIVSAIGSNANIQASVWYIMWGPNTVHGIYPKGSKAGIMSEDLGEVTLFDNDGGRFQGYRSHYQWKMGLCVRDWRYLVRICNIELNLLETAANQQALYKKMIQALYTVPQNAVGNGIFYAPPAVLAMLDIAAVEKSNAALGYNNVFGKKVLTFRGIPVRACNALLETEAVVT